MATPALPPIATIRKTPLVLIGIFLELLRGHFTHNSVRFPWQADETATKIILEPINKMDFEVVQKRPAVYVARGPITYQRIAINDTHSLNPREGEMDFAKTAMCTMTCLPLSRNPGEVELLAEEVSELLNVFTSFIKTDFGFQRFDIGAVSPPGVVQENREFFTTPISVGLQWAETWRIKCFSPKLRQVLLHVTTEIVKYEDGSLFSCGEPNEVGCKEEPSNELGDPFGKGGFG